MNYDNRMNQRTVSHVGGPLGKARYSSVETEDVNPANPPPHRGSGISFGRVVAVLAIVAAVAAVAVGVWWFGLRGGAKTPVLFLHGWMGKASNFDTMLSLLQKDAGFSSPELNAFDYECPEDVSIPYHAKRVAEEIIRYSEVNGGGTIDIVAHSMGGLVVREILRTYPDAARRIRRLVTLGTPHYGQDNSVGVSSRQMKYGSCFLYELAKAWTDGDGYRLPDENVLSIVGRDRLMDTDGLVDAWSASLEGSNVRYVNKTHASATHLDGAPSICKCEDGVNDTVYRLVKAFLKDGKVLPQTAFDSIAPLDVGGSIFFQIVDKSGNPVQSTCQVESFWTETAEERRDFHEYGVHWAEDEGDTVSAGQITSSKRHERGGAFTGYYGLPAGTYRILFRETSGAGRSFVSPAIRVDNNRTTVVPIVAEESMVPEPAVSESAVDSGDMSALIIRLDAKEKAEALSAVPEAFREKIGQYLFPAGEEIYEWFRIVRDSDYVQNNAAYKALAAKTRFRYNESTNEVNAFACGWDDLTEEKHENLNFFGGFVRFTRVIGAVMASGSLAGTNAPPRWSLLEDKVSLCSDDLSAKDAWALLAECGIAPEWFLNDAFVREARNIANGIGLSVAGHEMGHIAYGHIWRTGDINAETSRNKERDADSFSFSVSSEERTYAMGSISRYMFIGNVYLMVAWASSEARMVAALAKERGVSTPEGLEALRAEMMLEQDHPYSGERLLNLLTSKEDMAKQYGLDVAQISAILRERGIH